MPPANLTPEEALLWQCARQWRAPGSPVDLTALDEARLIDLALHNKMPVLLERALADTNLSPTGAARLAEMTGRFREKADTYAQILGQLGPLAANAGLKLVPMKGLWVAANLYVDPTVRPGHDLDVLVRWSQVPLAIALAEQLGFDRYWPGTLPDRYYLRHHLHLELSQADCWTWIEIHWAFDHPRTLLTIDYEAVIERARPGALVGAPVWDPEPADLLLYLSVHLVKHMIFLPAVLERPDLPRLILADGRLMYFLDVAEAVRRYEGEIDWVELVSRARAYGAVEILGAVLRVCAEWLDAPVPAAVLAGLRPLPIGRLRRLFYGRLADHLLAVHQGLPANRFWAFLVAPNFSLVFRPMRLLDLATYLWPPADFLRRRYGREGLGARLWHLLRTTAAYARLAWDTVVDSWRVRHRSLAPDVPLPPDSRCREAA